MGIISQRDEKMKEKQNRERERKKKALNDN